MKAVIYREEDIQKVTNILNSMQFQGFAHAKALCTIGDILDSGEIKERHEPREGKKDDSD